MRLDPPTMLFSLILTNAFMVVGLFVAASGGRDRERHDGIGKWAVAILLETLGWMLIAARGHIPDSLSIVAANGFLSSSYVLILAAVYEFQQRSAPRWQYFVPVILTLLIAAILIDDIHGRFIWGGIVFVLQLVLIASELLRNRATHTGRAWRLLLAGIAIVVVVLGLRSLVAMSGQFILAQPETGGVPNWVQVLSSWR